MMSDQECARCGQAVPESEAVFYCEEEGDPVRVAYCRSCDSQLLEGETRTPVEGDRLLDGVARFDCWWDGVDGSTRQIVMTCHRETLDNAILFACDLYEERHADLSEPEAFVDAVLIGVERLVR